MPTRNVVLTERHEKIVADLVASGRYQNASEVLRDGLRLIEEREAREAAKLKALQDAIQVGLDDLDAGRLIELQDFAAIEAMVTEIGNKVRARNDTV